MAVMYTVKYVNQLPSIDATRENVGKDRCDERNTEKKLINAGNEGKEKCGANRVR